MRTSWFLFNVLYAFALPFGTACREYHQENVVKQARIVVNSAGQLNDTAPSLFKVVVSQLDSLKEGRAVFFLDEDHGWVASNSALYATRNGGKDWSKTDVTVPSGAQVTQILFVKEPVGWLVLQKRTDYVLDNPEFRSWVLFTNDGGQSWSTQYQESRVTAARLAFLDENNGWITGFRYSGPGVNYSPVAFRTTDGGKNWSEVSQRLTLLQNKGASGELVNDGIMGIVTDAALGAVALSASMKLVETSDGGNSWRLSADLKSGDWSGPIKRFGKSGDARWIVSGMDSVEGTAGTLMVEESPNSWVRYSLGGAFFQDGLSVSNVEFMTSGYIKPSELKDSSREGAVFYTNDRGNHWTLAYRSNKVGAINALARASVNSVWAVANNGLVLNFTRLTVPRTAEN